MQYLQRTVLVMVMALPLTQMAKAEAPPQSASDSSDVPAVFPTDTRDNALWKQDDHIHTTPDAAVARFKSLDKDGDRRLQWDEVQVVDMERHIFRTLDTDGSGGLDREEYIAVSPSPENQYTTEAMPEP